MMTKQDLWWLDSVKVGDKLEIQPYWNESTKIGQLHGPLEVVAIRRTGRSQSGVLVSVKAEGHDRPTCLDAAWFIGPTGVTKWLDEDGWWKTKPNKNEKRTKPQVGQAQAPKSRE